MKFGKDNVQDEEDDFGENEGEEKKYNKEKYFEDSKNLIKKCNHDKFISAFFNEFYNDLLKVTKEREFLLFKLFKEKLITKDEFLNQFIAFIHKIWETIDDFPNLVGALGRIYGKFVRKGVLKYESIQLNPKAISEEYDIEMFFDFLENFVASTKKYLTGKVNFYIKIK